jgi:CheY-like chemotaxis protein
VPLVLALEPDPKQAAVIRQIVRDRVGAEFVLADSKDAALAVLADRVPDLILVTALLSPRDESDLTDHLRDLEGAEHLQTLTIPLLIQPSVAAPKKKKRGLLSALTGDGGDQASPMTSGCDPSVFAKEIADYIARAEEHRTEAAGQRARETRKPRKKGRGQAAATEPAPITTSSSSYWDWDPAPASASSAPPTALEREHTEQTTQATAFSSWANPWDVSDQPPVGPAAPSALVVEAPAPLPELEPATDAAAVEPTADVAAFAPAADLAAFERAADAVPELPVLEIDPVASLLLKPAPETAGDMVASAEIGATEEIDLSKWLDDDSPSAAAESESEIYTLPSDSFDTSAFDLAQTSFATGGVTADSPALDALRADLDRLRADRESVEAALTEARAAQHRAELAAEETSARAREELERRAREVEERAREEARVERRGRDDAERRAREESERRVDAERAAREAAERRLHEEAERRDAERRAREEAERLARDVEARMRAEADAERRLREEAERLAREAEDERRRQIEETRVREEAERKAREEVELQVAAERRAREEAERVAREAEDRRKREIEERRVREEAERQRAIEERRLREENERKAREEAEKKVAAERRARQDAEARAAAERVAREEAERRAREDAERRAMEAEERRTREEAERKAREAAEARAEAERLGRQNAERRAKEQAERIERRAKEEAERIERAAREEAARAAREAEHAAKEAAAKAREEAKAERKAREDAERRMLAERKAREEAERRAKQEADRRTEAEARAAREAERRAPEPATRAKKRAVNGNGKGRNHVEPRRAPQPPRPNGKPRPTLDEWGLYDPAKAGFGALYAKLEEIEDSDGEDDPDAAEPLDQTIAPATPPTGRNPRPLSMWAWRAETEPARPPARTPNGGLAADDFRGLVARLNIPPAIAAVSYASGARIRRVRVSPAKRQTKHDPSHVIILSRKLLNAVREQPPTQTT